VFVRVLPDVINHVCRILLLMDYANAQQPGDRIMSTLIQHDLHEVSTVARINSSVCKRVEGYVLFIILYRVHSGWPKIESWAVSAKWKPTCLSCVPLVLSSITEKDYSVQPALTLNVSHLLFLSDIFRRKSDESVWREYHELCLGAILESNRPRLPGKLMALVFLLKYFIWMRNRRGKWMC